jgi:hypothetical protein
MDILKSIEDAVVKRDTAGVKDLTQKVLNQKLSPNDILNKGLIKRLGSGLDAAILNPLDKNVMALVRSTEAFLNRGAFCVKYIEAFRDGNLG